MQLYDYYRSSASYRVRIALQLKKIPVELKEVHLVRNGGEQHSQDYYAINPQKLVPCLKIDQQTLTQSLAIIEYLEELFPEPAVLPEDPLQRAQARSLAQMISCDIHPLNNLRVLNYLKSHFKAEKSDLQSWYQHWVREGLTAFEKQLELLQCTPEFCIGNQISVADICLIPQVYNAKRFYVDLDDFPRINHINDACLKLPAFIQARPE